MKGYKPIMSLCYLLEVTFCAVFAIYCTFMISLYSFAPPVYCTTVCRTGCRQTMPVWEDSRECERACRDICYNHTDWTF